VLAACSVTMPSLSLDFMKSAPQDETLAIESEPPAAEAKPSLGTHHVEVVLGVAGPRGTISI
jgi:hypothetical protein